MKSFFSLFYPSFIDSFSHLILNSIVLHSSFIHPFTYSFSLSKGGWEEDLTYWTLGVTNGGICCAGLIGNALTIMVSIIDENKGVFLVKMKNASIPVKRVYSVNTYSRISIMLRRSE